GVRTNHRYRRRRQGCRPQGGRHGRALPAVPTAVSGDPRAVSAAAGGGRLTREDERQLQDRVADQFIQKILLERAYGRFGITVSDDEIIQAARSSPPPQIMQQVLQDPTFQTNGQFDITKWQRYISSAGSEFASQVEQLYRDYLPQRKLEE